MSTASQLIARLAAEGIAPDLLGEVATALVQAEAAQKAAADANAAIEQRRASDRERQAKRRSHVTSREVTGHPVTSRDPSPKIYNSTPNQPLTPSDPNGSEAPKGARRQKSILCPDDFEPSDSHFAKAEAAGRDRGFVFATRDRMHAWSHSNAGRPIARKSDWALAFHNFLDRALAEAPRSAMGPSARASPNGHSASPQQRALDRARQAHLDLMEDRHGKDPFEADAEGHLGAGRSANGHHHQDVHEPVGGGLRLAPPRPAFPPRTH